MKTFDDDSQFAGQEYYEPALDKRSKKIIDGLVDLQALVTREYDANGTPISYLNFRPSAFTTAKTRFADIVPKCKLSYDDLLKAVLDAIDSEAKRTGTKAEDGKHSTGSNEPTEDDFKQIQNEALQLAKKLIDANDTQFVSDNMQSVLGCKISEASISDYSSLVALVNIFKNR